MFRRVRDAETLKDLLGKLMLQAIEAANSYRLDASIRSESAKVKFFHLNDKFFEFDGLRPLRQSPAKRMRLPCDPATAGYTSS